LSDYLKEQFSRADKILFGKDLEGIHLETSEKKWCNNSEGRCNNHEGAFKDFSFGIEVARMNNGLPTVWFHQCNKKLPGNPNIKNTNLDKHSELWKAIHQIVMLHQRELTFEVHELISQCNINYSEFKEDISELCNGDEKEVENYINSFKDEDLK